MTEFDNLNDDDIARLSDALRVQLQPLQHSRPIPAVDRSTLRTVHRPRHPRRAILAAVAAVSAGALALSLFVGIGDNAAWAADPVPLTGELIDAVSNACALALDPGALEQSGSATPLGAGEVDSLEEGDVSLGGQLAPPSELPDLVAIDLRGDGGFAVFSTGDIGEASTVVSCVVMLGESVQVTSLSSEVGSSSADGENLTFGVGTTIANASGASTLTGSLVEGAVSVEVIVEGLPTARASIVHDRFAVWWPTTASATVRQLGESGEVLAETEVG